MTKHSFIVVLTPKDVLVSWDFFEVEAETRAEAAKQLVPIMREKLKDTRLCGEKGGLGFISVNDEMNAQIPILPQAMARDVA